MNSLPLSRNEKLWGAMSGVVVMQTVLKRLMRAGFLLNTRVAVTEGSRESFYVFKDALRAVYFKLRARRLDWIVEINLVFMRPLFLVKFAFVGSGHERRCRCFL